MPLPHLFLRHYRKLGVSHLQALFLLQLMEIAWDLGDPPSTVSKLAERLGVERRTIQICSRDLHQMGLIEVYDQFDEGGAQIENGYDLAPLFRRLALLAPEPRPAGQLRTRRNRYAPSDEPSLPPAPVDGARTPSAPPRTGDRPPPRTADHPLPGAGDRPSPHTADRTPVDQAFTAAANPGSELNRETKKTSKKPQQRTKKQPQEQQAVVVAAPPPCRQGVLTIETGEQKEGRSLRWNTPLGREEVARSRATLDRLGLSAAIVEAVAPTLHPAEVWSLWAYARGCHLAPAWIAKQIYDFKRKCARPSGLSSRYDDAGWKLASLDPAVAEQILDLVDEHCPHAPEAVLALLDRRDEAPADLPAVQGVWAVVAEQRGGNTRLRSGRQGKDGDHPPPVSAPASCEQVWRTVLGRLAGEVAPAAFATWLGSTQLVELIEDVAVVAAPNVFARDEVATAFGAQIAAALAHELGRQVEVEYVIGTLVDY